MHKYLRAIGFSKLKNRKQINELLLKAIKKADEKLYTTMDGEMMLAEYNLFCGEDMGISVRGEYDESNHFFMDYYVPFFRSDAVSSYADMSVERHAEKESYAGISDDINVGVSLIFYLQNIIPYIKRKNAKQLPIKGTSLNLAALSVEGMVVLPLYKSEDEIARTQKISKQRLGMLSKARLGDEEAIEGLTIGDMDTYSTINKMIVKQDVLSLVDTYFMPYGVECDQYAILAEIKEASKVKNKFTKEEIWQLTVECNNLTMSLCINAADLYGEPEAGRRFKGVIWLQGTINFPE